MIHFIKSHWVEIVTLTCVGLIVLLTIAYSLATMASTKREDEHDKPER